MKKLLTVFIIGAVLLVSAACVAPAPTQPSEIQVLTEENALQREQIAALEQELDLMRSQEGQASEKEQLLLSDLPNQTALIPLDPQLGGTLRFYTDQAKLLGEKYLYTYAEDGHVAAEMILQYQIEGEQITWSLALYDIGNGWKIAE